MDLLSISRAQQGIPLADVTTVARSRLRHGRAKERGHPPAAGRRGPSAARALAPEAEAGTLAAISLGGPFLSAGTLTRAERLKLLNGMEMLVAGLYTHLPLKRARYGLDPVQRLRILRVQADELDDDAFHNEVANITTQMRDAHTRYAGPEALDGKVAALPFLVESYGAEDGPTYVLSKVGAGLDPAFRPGVVIDYWNGTPIDRAVMRHGDNEVGGRPDSRRAWATQSLTLRSLRYGPPPDEHWVVVGYRAVDAAGQPVGPPREIKVPWRIVDPAAVAVVQGGPAGRAGGGAVGRAVDQGVGQGLRQARGVDPAAADVRRAKMLLFAPGALVGEQATPAAAAPAGATPAHAIAHAPAVGRVIPTTLTQTLMASTLDAPGGPYGHLRIYGFDTEPEAFVAELQRLLPLLPPAGLIIDIRGNPGGYIWAAETALQLFTPGRIEPTRFSVLATPFTRDLAAVRDLADELKPWRPSLDDAVRNGELYSQPIPITDVQACNDIGQRYGGPVVLVADSTTYSSGDLFSAGFVDNRIGPFVCVGRATGAGGANVWSYNELRPFLSGPLALPALPEGIDMTFSFRRATRSGPSEGLPIEDIGVAGEPYALTRDDLLAGNRDLLSHCIGLLRAQPASGLDCEADAAARTIAVRTRGLTRLDAYLDGHPLSSTALADGAQATVAWTAGTRMVELVGFAGTAACQRRRIPVA